MRAAVPMLNRTLTRRFYFVVYASAFMGRTVARPKLGDAEWMKRFREFVRAFNDFVIVLDDGKFDHAKWQQMRIEWQRLEVDGATRGGG
jgi:hypothetical protein